MALTDKSILDFGLKYRGKVLEDVPASYLLFIYNNNYAIGQELKDYIEDNLDVLEKQKEEEKPWEQ